MFIDIAWTSTTRISESKEKDFAIREFEIFLFQNLLIWRKFIFIKIHLVLVYYRQLIVRFNWFNLEHMVSESIKCTLHDTVIHVPAPGKKNLIPQKSGSIQISGDHPLLSFEIWLKTWGYTEQFYLPMVDRHLLEMMGPRCFQVIFIKYALHFVSWSFSTWVPVISSPVSPSHYTALSRHQKSLLRKLKLKNVKVVIR